MSRTAFLLVGAILCAANLAAQTRPNRPLNPRYLADMPSEERVQSAVQGSDPIDTGARQAGVFWQLRQLIYKVALSQGRNDRQQTPDEQRMSNEYYAAYFRAWQPVEQVLAPEKPRLFKLQGYTSDSDLLDEFLTRIGAATVRAEYAKADSTFASRRKARAEEEKIYQVRIQEQQKEQQKQAIADFQERAAKQSKLAQERRALARCIASGRSEGACVSDALGKDVVGMFPILKKSAVAQAYR